MSQPLVKLPSLFVSLLGFGAILLLVAYLQGPPRSVPGSQHLDFPLVPGQDSASTASLETKHDGKPASEKTAAAGKDQPLRVEISLEAGEFDIRPVGLGKSIVVEANYDEALHRLEHEFSHDPAGGDQFRLTFETRGSWRHLRRALHEAGHHGESYRFRHGDTHVRVDLPTGVPMDLTLKLGKGSASVDLSGLSLCRLTVEQAMGEARLVFETSNPIAMESLDLRGKMGELNATGLGYTRTRALDFSGRMGHFDLDLNGPWESDVDASVRVSMCDAVVRVPDDLRLQMSNRGVIMGGLHTPRPSRRQGAESNDATLILETSVRFGNLSIR